MSKHEGVFVLGIGARGALGLEARQLVFAARAGWTATRRRVLGPELGSVGVALSRALPDEIEGVDRCLRLAAPALEEARRDARAGGVTPSLLDQPLPIVLALPEPRVDDDPRFGRPFLEALGETLPGGIDLRRCDFVRGGHAGFAAVLQRAAGRITEAGPTPCVMAVGGIDSHGHGAHLADLDRRRRILSRRTVDGFVPGEAAAFAILGNAAALASGGPSVRLGDVALARQADEDDEDSTVAEALTRVVREVAETARGGRFGWAFTDLSNERHRQKEWSFVEIRQAPRLPERGQDVVRLGEDLGDLGAASGAVALAYATLGFRTGFAPSSNALVALSSEQGERGAFSVSRVD